MTRHFRTSRAPASPPAVQDAVWRGWAVAGILCGASLLYGLSPLPSLGTFDRHDEAFARGRLVRDLMRDIATAPHQTWVYWEGPQGTTWLLDRVGILLVVVAILAVSSTIGAALLAIGARLARTAGTGAVRWSRLERAAFAIGLGLSATSLFVRTLGFFTMSRDQFFAIALAAALVAIGVVLHYVLAQARRPVVGFQPEDDPAASGGFGWGWLWLALPSAVVILLGGLLPPLDFDVLEYHLQAPKEFYQLGCVEFLPHNVYANMPLGGEMFTLLALHATGDWWTGALVGKTIMAVYAFAAGLAVLAFGQRLGGTAVGVVAAILFLWTPWTIRIANLGLNENGLALFAVMTGHAASLWVSMRRVEMLILAGFFAGSAASIKYTGILFVVAPLVSAVVYVTLGVWKVRLLEKRGALASVGIVLLAVAAGCWPWYAANGWHTGNPFFPLFDGWFGGPVRGGELAAQWNAAHTPPNFSPRDFLGRAADFMWRSEWHNPLLVALAAIGVLFTRARWISWLVVYLTFYFLAWWLFTHRLDRFWVPAIPAMALVAGGAAVAAVGRLGKRAISWSLVAWAAISLVLAVHPASLCGYTRLLAAYDWLRDDPARIPLWRQNLNELAGREEAVLAVGDAAVFDLHARVYYNTVFDPWLLRQWLGDTSDGQVQASAVHTELLARDIGYVYVHWGELDRYRRTYDRGFYRSDFITPQLFEHLVEHGVLTPLAMRLAGANVSLFTVNRPAEEEGNANPR